MEIQGKSPIFSKEAVAFLKALHETFEPKRRALLEERKKRLETPLHPLNETKAIREDPLWSVAKIPKALEKRHVEITGPTDRKMMINALNSGADIFMADFEDAQSPIWEKVVEGQVNVMDAVRGTLSLKTEEKEYRLGKEIALLVIRPRGLHLEEKHIQIDGTPMSATLVDFGLSFFWNAKELTAAGKGPFYYIPKLESHLEARLFKELFAFAEKWMDLPQGTIRATILIETIQAAFEMEEILFELKDYAVGLNAGRWDYIFSIIKKFQQDSSFLFPDRSMITMEVPFMRAYCRELVRICHKRGAHAMGGMAAFVPNRKDAEVTEHAMQKVREDKEREVRLGFDGTWVAHPDLVPLAKEVFDDALGEKPHQKEKIPEPGNETLDDFTISHAAITEAGIHQNVSISLRYMDAWLNGVGAVAIDNLMEDAATAEISRGELWQWLHHGAISKEAIEEEIAKVPVKEETKSLLRELVYSPTFIPFFTSYAYKRLP